METPSPCSPMVAGAHQWLRQSPGTYQSQCMAFITLIRGLQWFRNSRSGKKFHAGRRSLAAAYEVVQRDL